MKVLLHICCGPCAVFPLSILKQEGHDVTGYFYNPNIHPYQEFKRRLSTLVEYAEISHLPVKTDTQYGLRDFVRQVAFNEERRCSLCYSTRLEKTVAVAQEMGCDAFSTTLLYSKYQQHSLIFEMCSSLSIEYGITFLYRDFREGWQWGIDRSIELEMYRQNYCGCIYSEQERYDKTSRKKPPQ